MIRFLSQPDLVLVGHNLYRWDYVHLQRVLGIKIKTKIVDTLALSWVLFPDREKHGLESWGESFKIPKPEIKDWHNLTQEEYEYRCTEDVKINKNLWLLILHKLKYLYSNSEKDIWKYIDYISFKMKCAQLQEKSGWKIDVEYCTNELKKLIEEQEEKTRKLQQAMPKVPIKAIRSAPKRMTKQDGTLSTKGEQWVQLLRSKNLPDETQEIEIVTGYEEGNPGSTQQKKDWLFSLGWVPQEIKYVKDKKTGETKEIPQINLPHGKGICPGIIALFEKEPALEYLQGLSILDHRIPILKKFLRMRDKNDMVLASVKGLTNTLRFQHTDPCVNLPKSDKPYASAIRGSLISREGYILCGSDMSSLEDRLKQHFIFPLDPDYVRQMMQDDYDPHLTLALKAEAVTQQQIDDYKSGKDKSIKPIRDIYKAGNYAGQYGAFPKRLAITCGISLKEARKLFDDYWALNWAIKEVSKQQIIKYIGEEMWLKNPINGFYYSLRGEKDIFSTLVQGSASFVFDTWLGFVLEEREQLTAQFHDEFVLEIKEGFEEVCKELITRAINKTNDKLKLNRELGVDIQFGKRYSNIH